MFQFKNFALHHENSTLKIGTDSVLLASLVPVRNVTRVLDVGCGCGVIAFCIANRVLLQNQKTTFFAGIDIDENSVKEATQNADIFPKILGNAEFDFQRISLQQFAEQSQASFDLIVSNPPFFTHSLKPADATRSQSKHNDISLSFSDLVKFSAQLLAPDGKFYVILPTSELSNFEAAAHSLLYVCEKIWIQSLPAKLPNRVVVGCSKMVEHFRESSLTIRDENGDFSQQYKNWTKLFYLDF